MICIYLVSCRHMNDDLSTSDIASFTLYYTISAMIIFICLVYIASKLEY
jgi:hypothetical protein